MRMDTRASETATVLRLPGGRELAFGEFGDGDGFPVLAFHGTPGLRLQLAPVDASARAAGVRLVVPDRPGYGHSDFVKHRRLTDWPADVQAIADHLGFDRFGLLGISGGGPHALACAALLPERLTRVAVVSSPSPFGSDAARAVMTPTARYLLPLARFTPLVRVGSASLVKAMRMAPPIVEGLERLMMPAVDRRVLSALRAEVEDEMRHTSFSSGRAAAQDIGLLVRDWGFEVERIGVPATVWHGERDRVARPFHARVLASLIPGSTLRMCPDEGHLLFTRQAQTILEDLAGRRISSGSSVPGGHRRDN